MGERDARGQDHADARLGRALRDALRDAPDGVPDPRRVEEAVRAVLAAAPARRSRRGAWLAAAVATVVFVGVAAGWQLARRPAGPEPATVPALRFSPTQERDPRVLLSGLAGLAERQPGPAGSGSWLYRVGRQWNFGTAGSTSGQVLAAGLGEDFSQSWTGADASVRGRRASVDPPGGGGGTLVVDHPAKPAGEALPPVGAASAEQVREWLFGQVRSGTSTSPGDERSTAQWFEAVGSERAADDPVFAAVGLRILASLPGITVEGETRDRAGRRAVAVSAVSDRPGSRFPRQRLYLLIDPRTGMVLAREAVALTVDEDALGTSVPVPTTTGYRLWFPGVFVADERTRAFLAADPAAGAVAAVRGRAWCFRSADLRDRSEAVGTGDPATPEGLGGKERGPVEVCSSTWEGDSYGWVSGSGEPDRHARGGHTAPPLVACVVTEQVPGVEPTTVVGVFPGGQGTCAALGLPDAR